MPDSDLTCHDLFQCGFINCTEVTSELHCFETGFGTLLHTFAAMDIGMGKEMVPSAALWTR